MKLNIKEAVVFAMFGAIMYLSKLLLEFLPNVHLIGVFIVTLTIVYRQKALYPLYVFVFLTGLLNGFSLWWIPYLYIWAVLWGGAMLIPEKRLPEKAKPFVYMAVCSLHGFLYGTLYAPAQAIMFHLDFKGMISWIIAGLPWDAVHGVSNFCCGILIYPLIKAIRIADRAGRISS